MKNDQAIDDPTQYIIDEIIKLIPGDTPPKRGWEPDGRVELWTSNGDFLAKLDGKRIWLDTGFQLITSNVSESRFKRFMVITYKNYKGEYDIHSNLIEASDEFVLSIEAGSTKVELQQVRKPTNGDKPA